MTFALNHSARDFISFSQCDNITKTKSQVSIKYIRWVCFTLLWVCLRDIHTSRSVNLLILSGGEGSSSWRVYVQRVSGVYFHGLLTRVMSYRSVQPIPSQSYVTIGEASSRLLKLDHGAHRTHKYLQIYSSMAIRIMREHYRSNGKGTLSFRWSCGLKLELKLEKWDARLVFAKASKQRTMSSRRRIGVRSK